ncbi:hypothetical protein GTP56_02385 [Duganella sp. FT134W]|uniref:Uncharacterized protein n=1 Tax=Duganella margarita TaxID=2692170 RepID=A0A7X4GYE3_9BURK|nr:hypothetical protein [Duganella margarita]MYM71042.1 hypothetical protein [Duganella margarita]
MTPPTNNSEAQVAILEARVDGRISSVEVTFANFVKVMDEREKVASERHKASAQEEKKPPKQPPSD